MAKSWLRIKDGLTGPAEPVEADAIVHDDEFSNEGRATQLNEESVAAKGDPDEGGDGSSDPLPAEETEDAADDEHHTEDPSQHHHLRPPSVESDGT